MSVPENLCEIITVNSDAAKKLGIEYIQNLTKVMLGQVVLGGRPGLFRPVCPISEACAHVRALQYEIMRIHAIQSGLAEENYYDPEARASIDEITQVLNESLHSDSKYQILEQQIEEKQSEQAATCPFVELTREYSNIFRLGNY